jgi:ferredoxin
VGAFRGLTGVDDFDMPNLTLDKQELEVPDGTTILQAARSLGISIPTLCYRKDCRPETSCFVCLVKVQGSERFVPSCATVCTEGMVIESETPEVHAARKLALELLLSDHRGDCVAPCHFICPANLDIPEMITLIKAGCMRDAVALTKQTIPFPAVLGRICAAFCEKGCRRADLDSPIAIRLLKRLVGDFDLACADPHVPECRPDTGKRVAIIGAGPAGLTAGYYLRQAGHGVVLFEADSALGGGLRTGVPASFLSPSVLSGEVDNLLRVGLEVRTGVRVGQDISLEDLRRQFDAVLVACGELDEAAAAALGLSLHGGPAEASLRAVGMASCPAAVRPSLAGQDAPPTGTGGVPAGPSTRRGKGLAHDRETLMTEKLGVFVAGSALTPSHHSVRAVGTGRLAAQAISQYLAGRHLHVDHRPYTVLMGPLDPGEMAVFALGASTSDRVPPEGGEATGLGADEAHAETARCLQCDCEGVRSCRLRHWGHVYEANPHRLRISRKPFARDRSHPDLTYEPGKCIACGLCVQIAETAREQFGLTFIGRGFRVQVSVPFDETLADGLQEVARQCAKACPTAALMWRTDETPC